MCEALTFDIYKMEKFLSFFAEWVMMSKMGKKGRVI